MELSVNTEIYPFREFSKQVMKVSRVPSLWPHPFVDTPLSVPYYQPETAYQIFKRVMSGLDVATGEKPTGLAVKPYSTKGPASIFGIKNVVHVQPPSQCYLWDIMETCTGEQTLLLRNGSAILKDFVMIGYHLGNGSTVYY